MRRLGHDDLGQQLCAGLRGSEGKFEFALLAVADRGRDGRDYEPGCMVPGWADDLADHPVFNEDSSG